MFRFIRWLKGRNWLLRKKNTKPVIDIQKLSRTYYIKNCTSNPDPKEWRWDKKPTPALNVQEAVRTAWTNAANWVKMSYEIVWCSETQETLYVATFYPDNGHDRAKFTLMDNKPSVNPVELYPKPIPVTEKSLEQAVSESCGTNQQLHQQT